MPSCLLLQGYYPGCWPVKGFRYDHFFASFTSGWAKIFARACYPHRHATAPTPAHPTGRMGNITAADRPARSSSLMSAFSQFVFLSMARQRRRPCLRCLAKSDCMRPNQTKPDQTWSVLSKHRSKVNFPRRLPDPSRAQPIDLMVQCHS